MRKDHAEAHRAAVVLHIECVTLNSERLRESANDASEAVKGVVELLRVGPVAVPEAWVVRRDQMIVVCQPLKKRLKHTRRRRQSMQQKKRWRILQPGLAV